MGSSSLTSPACWPGRMPPCCWPIWVRKSSKSKAPAETIRDLGSPPVRPDGVSTYYSGINRNKKSVVLDLRNAGDLAAARELAARADVVIENFKPGGLRKFGLDYASVKEFNESVIYCSISGFGTAGGASLPGYDLIVQAMSGLMSLTGDSKGGNRTGPASASSMSWPDCIRQSASSLPCAIVTAPAKARILKPA